MILKNILALLTVLLIASMVTGCENDADNNPTGPIALVPQQANILVYIDLPRILDEVNVEGLIEEIPKEPDDPQSLQEALDLLGINEIGEAAFFGNVSELAVSADLQGQNEGYFGFIMMGSFNEEQLIDTIETENDDKMTTTSYKGYTIYSDSEGEISLAFLDEQAAVIGTERPVKDVIEIKEGDQKAVKGNLLRTYNDLGSGLFKLALAMPEELLESIQADMNEDDMMGINPLGFIDGLQTVGLVVEKHEDSVPVDARICFVDEESAENMKGMLGFFTAMMDFEDMELDVSEDDESIMGILESLELNLNGTCVEIGLVITSEMIDGIAESFQEGFEEGLEDFGIGSGEDEYDIRKTELANIELSIAAMMADPDVPVRSLATDERIADFAGTEAEATNYMSDGGIVTITQGSDVNPPSEYFGQPQTKYRYWVEANGRVYQVGFVKAPNKSSGNKNVSSQTEMANVELAVAACMASPDMPVRDLLNDPRIASITQCDPDARSWEEVSDPTVESLTQDVKELITINSGLDINPLSDFTNSNELNNWYCVYSNGRVTGFTDERPHQNIRHL